MSNFRYFTRSTGKAAATVTLAVGLALSPMMEGIARAKDNCAEVAKPQAQKPEEKPFFSSEKLPDILKNVKGTADKEKTESLFSLLKVGNGVLKTVKAGGDKRAPRNVDETIEKGGDCTEFSFVVITALKMLGINGGAVVIHREGAKKGEDHMVAYATLGDQKFYIDPQAEKSGEIKGKYTLVMDLTFAEAEGIYHREMGNYYKLQSKTDEAIAAFEKAVALNVKDAYCHNSLGVLYEKKGDVEHAKEHYDLAVKYDPDNKTYEKNKTVGTYNEELKAAYDAFEKEDYKSAKEHFENALNSGEKLSDKEKKELKKNIGICEQMIQQQEKN
ncbi:tetratricopeptide repeat protein [Candidatus Micrarchaeota archaeon]|nr:tetratricopeptide repeat protein [Candidatus Micrarchaeota archaeon]